MSNIVSGEWTKNVRRAKNRISHLYSVQSPSGTFSIIQLDDKSKKDFSEITQEVAEFKKALIAWSNDPLNDNLINQISDFAEYFNEEGEKAAVTMSLATGPRQTLEALVQNNAALAYAITGNLEAARQSFAKTDAISAFSKARNFTAYYFSFKELRNLPQTEDKTINVSAIIDK
ncbi:MAG: hypothetical protein LBG19_06175 [Prevotellaceae bacterium]|jgi:hypothetical protein|nr:hypothetical protein [Prevotellaceae bacterium]